MGAFKSKRFDYCNQKHGCCHSMLIKSSTEMHFQRKNYCRFKDFFLTIYIYNEQQLQYFIRYIYPFYPWDSASSHHPSWFMSSCSLCVCRDSTKNSELFFPDGCWPSHYINSCLSCFPSLKPPETCCISNFNTTHSRCCIWKCHLNVAHFVQASIIKYHDNHIHENDDWISKNYIFFIRYTLTDQLPNELLLKWNMWTWLWWLYIFQSRYAWVLGNLYRPQSHRQLCVAATGCVLSALGYLTPSQETGLLVC